MALLKRKADKTYVFSIRLPISKDEMNALRKLADDAGYDLSASLADHMLKGFKQIREELTAANKTASSNGGALHHA